MVFAAGNKWLDLKTGIPIIPSSSKLLSIQSAVNFNATASCDQFLKFWIKSFRETKVWLIMSVEQYATQ